MRLFESRNDVDVHGRPGLAVGDARQRSSDVVVDAEGIEETDDGLQGGARRGVKQRAGCPGSVRLGLRFPPRSLWVLKTQPALILRADDLPFQFSTASLPQDDRMTGAARPLDGGSTPISEKRGDVARRLH